MPRQFFSGNSIEQAVMSAARHYKIDPERLAYKLRDKKHGFLNIRRRVVIEVDPENLETAEDLEPAEPASMASEPVSAPSSPAVAESGVGDDGEAEPAHDGHGEGEPPESESEPVEAGLHGEDQEEDEDADEGDELEEGDDVDDDDVDDVDDDADDDDIDDDADDDDADDDDIDDDADADDDDADVDDERDERDEREKPQKSSPRGGRARSERSGRGRGRQGGKRKRQRRRDVEVEEFFWNDDEDGWDSDDVEPGDTQELTAVELCVERILDVMDLEIEYTITEGQAIELEFSGEDAEFLTEDNGKVLKAIEQIVPRMVRGLIGRSITVNADCDGFRADHEDSLQELAEEAAQEVMQSGKPKTLNAMNPADRRIVHLSLVDHPDVETVSQGHGFMKRVKILPAGS